MGILYNIGELEVGGSRPASSSTSSIGLGNYPQQRWRRTRNVETYTPGISSINFGIVGEWKNGAIKILSYVVVGSSIK